MSEYLVIYKKASWENFANYRGNYSYFKTSYATLIIYSDTESYWARMKNEWIWLLVHTLIYLPVGMSLLLFILSAKNSQNTMGTIIALREVLLFLVMLDIILPIGVDISVAFSFNFYRDQTK
ncbi:hypothetical protein I580_00768 [Enterococcus caccae ATCC BAA-1240]|uniref:Uncharacterized protein n=1 Tax=Enterococcus caccae ATCC BAA-1240 TaxID=1158612 RepID=R3WMY0_9ENTE|nr:hypothetical protein UC7_02544 [Enterococcus caccae ATCC BAA-1240]EOT68385.1 hypothetical protein I580_00768 [Enterococcus caccae ATCC BAA-1240]